MILFSEKRQDELYHHGILGQKWGIRRYQNPDGSLTEAGRKRYGVNSVDEYKAVKKGIENGAVEIIPNKSIGKLEFLMPREEVRTKLDLPYQVQKKTSLSKNTMDAYDGFHVYYNDKNLLQAVEFFDNHKITISGKEVFPGKIKTIRRDVKDLAQNGDYYISKELSIGLTVSEDGETISSILVGNPGYYK